MQALQGLVFYFFAHHSCTKFSFKGLTSKLNSNNYGIVYKKSWLLKDFILLAAWI